MEKNSRTTKRLKFKKKPKAFKCVLCESVIFKNRDIITRKNYTHGKKSKAQVSHIHRIDGGCLVELRKKNETR